METQKIAKQFRLSNWCETVRERVGSGQSVKDFCKATEIGRSTYYYRQRKVREAAYSNLQKVNIREKGFVPNGWKQLVTKEETITKTESTIIIETGGFSITVKSDTDTELLRRVCAVLRML